MFFFSKLLKRGKRLIPQLRKVVPQQRQALGIQFIDPPRAFPPVAYQPCILQDPQMLGNGRARYRQARRKLVHGMGMVAQHLENGQPGGVAQRRQSVLYVRIHLR